MDLRSLFFLYIYIGQYLVIKNIEIKLNCDQKIFQLLSKIVFSKIHVPPIFLKLKTYNKKVCKNPLPSQTKKKDEVIERSI